MADSSDDADRSDESETDDADEFELERAYDRADLAGVFREFATAFESGRSLRLDGDDRTVEIAVPERVVAEFEAERDPDAEPPVGELELELEWDDPEGTSVRVTDRAVDEPAEGDGRSASADADPATAVMPLEGVTDAPRADSADGVAEAEAVETDATAEGAGDTEGTAEADRTDDSERTSRFEVYEDKAGQWRWRLVHWNGNIVADSGEGYSSRSNAERAARSVMRSAPSATIQRRD